MAKRKKIMPFFKYLTFIMVLITIITLGLFKFIDILPLEYFMVLVVLLGFIVLGLSALILTRRGTKKRVVGTFLGIIYIIFLILVIMYELNTLGFLKKLGFKNYKTENYSVVVLKSSSYNSINDLYNKKVGSLEFNTVGLKEAEEKISKKIKLIFKTYDDVLDLSRDFSDDLIDAMLIEDSLLAILCEDNKKFTDSFKVIYDFALDIETEDISKNVDITKDSFNIYVSGIDTYGAVSSVSRSDVNMIISVNPRTGKLLITSIPRDYYIELGTKPGKDKLTHAGIYGVSESVKTLEKLFDIRINYYVKLNFTSLIKIVDALGGVNVYSKYAFTSKDNYKYKEGYNTLNGNEALSFVRERKAFSGGDRVRVMNQAAMVKALIDKAVSPAIITKYNSLLNTLDGSFITNLKTEAITDFIKMQIKKNINWEVLNVSVDGVDSFQYTYSFKGAKLYVMEPNKETVEYAKKQIKEVLGD